MIDPQLLRENPESVRRSQQSRGSSVELVDAAVAADARRRASIQQFEKLRAEQNAFSRTVATAPKDEKRALVLQAQALATQVKDAQQVSQDAEAEFAKLAGAIGNVTIDGVPAGGEDDWKLVREVGTPRSFDFEPRDHAELGELLGAIDIARGVKVSGSRFYFLAGVGAHEIADKPPRGSVTPTVWSVTVPVFLPEKV